jgi:hypothetical protein
MENPGARASSGGWGLGEVHEDSVNSVEEDDEDEPWNWDEAQVCSCLSL